MFRSPRRWLALAVIPLVLILSSCRMHMGLVVLSEHEVAVSMDFGMLKSDAEVIGMTGEDFCDMGDESGAVDESEADVTTRAYDDGTWIGCVIEATGPVEGEEMLRLDGDVWTFHMPADGSTEAVDPEGLEEAGMDLDFRFFVTFPGEVLSHNGSSHVEGTSVVWTDINDMSTGEGLLATARHGETPGSPPDGTGGGATPPEETEEPGDPTPTPEPTEPVEETTEPVDPTETTDPVDETDDVETPEDEGSEGMPVWAWVAIGALGVVLAGAIIALVLRRGKNGGDDNQAWTGQPGPQQPPYGQGGVPPQGGGYPQQGGYHQQGPGPQQGGQPGGYPPAGAPPQQGGYPQQGPGPQQGGQPGGYPSAPPQGGQPGSYPSGPQQGGQPGSYPSGPQQGGQPGGYPSAGSPQGPGPQQGGQPGPGSQGSGPQNPWN